MPRIGAVRQRQLFEEPPAAPAVRLPLEVQQRLRQALVHWMQALVKTIREQEKCGTIWKANGASTPLPVAHLRWVGKTST